MKVEGHKPLVLKSNTKAKHLSLNPTQKEKSIWLDPHSSVPPLLILLMETGLKLSNH